jgi:hypothetical protein
VFNRPATGKILGIRWSQVDVVTKQKYIDLAVADKVRFDEEMKVYSRPAEEDDTLEYLINTKKSELATIAKEYGIKPKGKRDDVAVAIMTKIQNTTYVKDTSKKSNIISKWINAI